MSTPAIQVDYYKILGLAKDASSEDVRRAYKQKVLETHPDKLPPDSTEEEKEAAHIQFSKVHQASEILGDPDLRREYDIHYRELPDPSIKSATSPKSSTISVSRSDSVSTVRTAGSRPATLRRTPSMVSLNSTSSASKSHNDSSSFVSSTGSSMTSAQDSLASEKVLSRANSVVNAPQSVARTNSMSSSHSASTKSVVHTPQSVARTNSVTSSASASIRPAVHTPQSVARTNSVTSSHNANGTPSPLSRANSSASARQGQGTISRSNSATVHGARPPPSLSRNGTVSSDHQLPSPLSRAPSTSSNREPSALPSISRTNSAATVRSSKSTSTSTHVPQPVSRANSAATVRSSTSTSTPTYALQPRSRSNSIVTAAPQPASVSRTNSITAVTAISLHETASVVRSNSNATVLSSVSARSKVKSTWSDRLSMANFAGAFSDLPSPPYSQPKDYEALVEAMLQQLYHLNPEWVKRKQRLQQIKAQREAGNKIDPKLWRASWAP